MARNQPQGQPATVECPHIHFKTNVIDRDILTKRQHLNLLCTPKGYRWEVAFVKEEEQRLVCSSKSHGKPKRSYVYNLLADLWSVVTPEMVSKLQEMMVNEFGLSREEATDFVCKQMKEMIHAMRRKKGADMSTEDQPYPLFISKDVQQSEQVRCRCQMSINVKPSIVKKMTDVLAGKLAEAAMFMMHGKKGHRQRRMSEVLFNGFCRISGDTFNPKEPKSKLHKLQVFLADKLAMWLAETFIDERAVLAKNRKREDRIIQRSSLKRAKDYEKKVRERAALARKIEIQKKVAEEREKEAKRREEEAKKYLEESRKKQMEEWKKRDEAQMKQEKARLKEKAKKEKKKEDTKNKHDAAGLVGDITAKAEKKNSESKKKNKKQKDHKAPSKPAAKPDNSGVKKKDNKGKKK